tara:strand:- start:1228 stop:1434 length:207 start_codon:yes stop_codon:yes gene_type:complete
MKRPYSRKEWEKTARFMLRWTGTSKSEFESAYIALRRDNPDLAAQLLKASKSAPDWRKLAKLKGDEHR